MRTTMRALVCMGVLGLCWLGGGIAAAEEPTDDEEVVDERVEPEPTAPSSLPAPPEMEPQAVEPVIEDDPSPPLPPEAYDRRGKLRSRLVAPDGYDAPPHPYVASTRMHRGLVIGGAAAMGGTWAVTSLVSVLGYGFSGGFPFQDGELDGFHLFGIVPLIGPFVVAGRQISRGELDGYGGTLIGFGVAQGATTALLIAGLSTDQEIWVLDRTKVDSPRVSLSVSPSLTGLRGEF